MNRPTTSTDVKRVIYFTGSKDQDKSALITKICKNYETLSGILKKESATRTLLNLYNLHAVRGPINSKNELIIDSSMSGPHHYFGWIDPTKYYSLYPDPKNEAFLYYEIDTTKINLYYNKLQQLPMEKTYILSNVEWLKGENIDQQVRNDYAIHDELSNELIDEVGERDSLFDNPGLLLLDEEILNIPLIWDSFYDLSPFRAQLVRNDSPWCFNQESISRFKHAQHRLRVITYNYGENYLQNYLMKGSGIFIERHEFVQAITPMNKNCGGFVILGREIEDKKLQLIGVCIPYGFTLLIDVDAIHGDSTLTGLHQMAMTGNHNAMKTANSVFIKNRNTKNNVSVLSTPVLPERSYNYDNLLLTSDRKSLENLHEENSALTNEILQSLPPSTRLWWQPVIFTLNITRGKTIGRTLPKV